MRISDWSSDVCSADLVGAGLVGAGWAIVFARAGQSVSIYDAQPAIRASVMDWIRDSLNEMERCGLTRDVPSILARITVSDSLEDAVAEADYVQESVFERVEVKHRISLAIGAAIRVDLSEERRVGNEWVSTCRYRGWAY